MNVFELLKDFLKSLSFSFNVSALLISFILSNTLQNPTQPQLKIYENKNSDLGMLQKLSFPSVNNLFSNFSDTNENSRYAFQLFKSRDFIESFVEDYGPERILIDIWMKFILKMPTRFNDFKRLRHFC